MKYTYLPEEINKVPDAGIKDAVAFFLVAALLIAGIAIF